MLRRRCRRCRKDIMAKIILPGTGLSMRDFVIDTGDEINRLVVATSKSTLKAVAKSAKAAIPKGTPVGPAIAAALTASLKDGCRICVRHGLTGKLEPKEFKRYFCSMTFHPMSAEAAITDFERHVKFVTAYGVEKSMSRSQAAALIASPDLKDRLYHLSRIFEFPIPIKKGNSIEDLEEGLHLSHVSKKHLAAKKAYYCGPDIDMDMSLQEAHECIAFIFNKFCWDEKGHPQSRDHAIARLLTPYCQGIMGFTAKSPLWIFQANRSRAGKDYCAAIAPIVFEGNAYEDAPLDQDDSENKRRITSAIISGQKFMHFANCKTDLDRCPSLEGAVTAKFWHDRIIGTSETVKMANEIIYSLSFNGNLKLSEDIANRTRRIKLFMPPDMKANGRDFPDLHGWLLKDDNRRTVIAALKALVKNWISKGKPPGSVKFTSFPEWAEVVGGIMEAADFENPCYPDDEDQINISRTWYDDICSLAEVIGTKQSGVPLPVRDIVENYVKKDSALIERLNSYTSEDSYKKELGQKLHEYSGKDLGGGMMVIIDYDDGKRRPRYSFYPIGGKKTPPASAGAAGDKPGATPGSDSASPSNGQAQRDIPETNDADRPAPTSASPSETESGNLKAEGRTEKTSTVDMENPPEAEVSTPGSHPPSQKNKSAGEASSSVGGGSPTTGSAQAEPAKANEPSKKEDRKRKKQFVWSDVKEKPRWMTAADFECLKPVQQYDPFEL